MDPNYEYVGIIVSVFNKERYTHATKAEVIGFQTGSNNEKVLIDAHLLCSLRVMPVYNDSCVAGGDPSARGALAAERLARGPRANRHEHSLPARAVLVAAVARGGDDELRTLARPTRHLAASRPTCVRHS